jgi:GTPase
MTNEKPCGYVAIVGRPNVGKSTLLNHLLGQKISITSRKPQTTRHRLLGIKTTENYQVVYVDTPGLHQDHHNAMNRYLNRTAKSSLEGVDVILWLVEATHFTAEDAYVLTALSHLETPTILVVNKVDKFTDKNLLLPYIQEVGSKREFKNIYPISALKDQNLTELETGLVQLLPLGTPVYPEDQLTDRNERFLTAEFIREKLVRHLGAELPYRIGVQIESFQDTDKLISISSTIWVERPGQKAIVIGKDGAMLKAVGQEARHDLEELLGKHVFLQLWVKVKKGWSDDERALRQLGYFD